MKLKTLTIAGLLITTAFATPAQAQRVLCVRDQIDNDIVCGREASRREIRQYEEQYRDWQINRRRRGIDNRRRDRYDRNDRYDRDYDRRSEIEYKINELYREVLGRNADRNGQRTFTNAVINGKDYQWVRRELATSDEARQSINQVYREVLGRNADRNGIETYISRIKDGWSLNDVRRDIANSDEARNIRGRRRR